MKEMMNEMCAKSARNKRAEPTGSHAQSQFGLMTSITPNNLTQNTARQLIYYRSVQRF
jgi:hypothetical protein